MLLGHESNNQPVFLSEHDLDRHGYLIGLTGTGKTTMLLNTASGADLREVGRSDRHRSARRHELRPTQYAAGVRGG